jgi:hypothetical protein
MTYTPEDPRQARALDALLARDIVPPPSAGLRRAILLGFAERAQAGFWRSFWRELGGLRVVAPALATSLALGIAVATFVPSLANPVEAVDQVADEAPAYAELAMLDGAYEEYLP